MSKPTAILIFAQDVSQEISRKNLAPRSNQGANRQVFRQLNSFVGRTCSSTNLPVFYSNQLITNNTNAFGKQLSEAIQVVLDKGFEKIICVGNDCPALHKTQILEAAEKLQTVDSVIGPDERGGVYLLGISKDTFNAEIFETIAWQSKNMLESYFRLFPQQSVSLVETLADIHTFKELQTYTSSRYFIVFLLQIIEKLTSKIAYLYTYLFDSQLVRHSSLRGPPAVFGISF